MKNKNYGLIGKKLSHSFSQDYFTQKFSDLNLHNYKYKLYPLNHVSDIIELIIDRNVSGLNITIPYKEDVIPLLDQITDEAHKVGAVNTIKVFNSNGRYQLKGYNTDVFGFERMVKPFIKSHHERALILGTGGAAKAVCYVLKQKGIDCLQVSRTPNSKQIGYDALNEYTIKHHPLIVNCTPVGTTPNISDYPNIPYEELTPQHTLIDLIYNPEETEFLKKGKAKGTVTINGMVMLQQQAEKAWEIWNSEF